MKRSLTMRSLILCAALSLGFLPPARAAAQEPFEGMLTMKMGGDPGETPKIATIWAKGGKMRMEMAGGEQTMTVLADGKGSVMMLMPEQKKYYVMMSTAEIAKMAATGAVTLKKLGRSGRFAGYGCDWYAMARQGNESFDACVTRDLGSLGIDLAAQGGQSGLTDADLKAFRKEFGNNFFVLQQKGEGGKVLYEVTKVEKTRVADDRFVPPAGYSELKMPGAARKP